MIRTMITTDDLERARVAYTRGWLAEDQRQQDRSEAAAVGDRTRCGLKAALAELGIAVVEA